MPFATESKNMRIINGKRDIFGFQAEQKYYLLYLKTSLRTLVGVFIGHWYIGNYCEQISGNTICRYMTIDYEDSIHIISYVNDVGIIKSTGCLASLLSKELV